MAINYDPMNYVPNYSGIAQGINQAVGGIASGIGQIADIKITQKAANTDWINELNTRRDSAKSFLKTKGVDLPEDQAGLNTGYDAIIDELSKQVSSSSTMSYDDARSEVSRIFTKPSMRIETDADKEKFQELITAQSAKFQEFKNKVNEFKGRESISKSFMDANGSVIPEGQKGYYDGLAKDYNVNGNAQSFNDLQSGVAGLQKGYVAQQQDAANTDAVANATNIPKPWQDAYNAAATGRADEGTRTQLANQAQGEANRLDKASEDAAKPKDNTDKLEVRYQRRVSYIDGQKKQLESQLNKVVGQYVNPNNAKGLKTVSEFLQSPTIPKEVKDQYNVLSAQIEATDDAKDLVDQWYETNQETAQSGYVSPMDPANTILEKAYGDPKYLDKKRKELFDLVNNKYQGKGYRSTSKSRSAEQAEAEKAMAGTGKISAPPSGGVLGMGVKEGGFKYNGSTSAPLPPAPAPTGPVPSNADVGGAAPPVKGRVNTQPATEQDSTTKTYTPEEAISLPSGTRFRTTDGRILIKK